MSIFFFGKMSILKTILTFVETIEFVGVKTTQLNIFPGGIRKWTKIGEKILGSRGGAEGPSPPLRIQPEISLDIA